MGWLRAWTLEPDLLGTNLASVKHGTSPAARLAALGATHVRSLKLTWLIGSLCVVQPCLATLGREILILIVTCSYLGLLCTLTH